MACKPIKTQELQYTTACSASVSDGRALDNRGWRREKEAGEGTGSEREKRKHLPAKPVTLLIYK